MSAAHPVLPRSAGRHLLLLAAIAAAYAVVGRLGLLLAIPPGYATAVWPASGVALAAILLGGRRLWPGVLLGSFLVNIWTSLDSTSLAALAKSAAIAVSIGGGAALQALAGAYLIRRFVGYRNIFTQEVDVVRILFLGGPLSCVVNSLVGVGTLWAAGLIPAPNLLFNWWTWWVGDSIGVLIFLPLICAWALRPQRRWLRQQVALTLPLMAMFAVVVCLFFFVSSREQTRLQTEFERTTERIGEGFQARVDSDLTVLDAVRSFFAASDHVSEQQFGIFVASQLQAHPDIRALEWLPRVSAAELPGFEAGMRAAGNAGFRVWQKDGQGSDLAVTPRPVYFPVAYLAPRQSNEVALGYDDASEPTRGAALQHAIDSGRVTATARIRLVQETGEQWGAILFAPVFRDPSGEAQPRLLLGFALAVFRIGDLAQSSLQDVAGAGMKLRLMDNTPGEQPAVLCETGEPELLKPRQIAKSRAVQLRVAERLWTLEFTLPADYLVAHRSWQAWGLLAVGLLITGLLGILILVLIARQAKVEELVLSQTAELKLAQGRFRRLLENTPDAMVITDQAGTIQLVNAQIERLFGYSREEMIGQSVELMVPERLRRQHVGYRTGYFGRPQARPMGANIELWGRRKDGSEVPVEISLSPLETEDGTWATAAIRDISERKAAEQRLADYAKDLERSNGELEQFAYVASHDLQAPLRSIVGFGQILRQDYLGRLDAEADTYIQFMVKSAAQMQSLIRDLLTYSRIGREGALGGPADCGEALAEVQLQLQSLIRERGAQITHDPLPVVACAPLELRQVLQNLIGNAIKFQTPGRQPLIHVAAVREGREWKISVRDNGIGIEPRYRERIFQMFQRLHTSEQYEGTGIGLAICRKIVQRCGGRLWAESEPGQGSTFCFTLRQVAPDNA